MKEYQSIYQYLICSCVVVSAIFFLLSTMFCNVSMFCNVTMFSIYSDCTTTDYQYMMDKVNTLEYEYIDCLPDELLSCNPKL